MKLRITPLALVTAGFILAAVYFAVFFDQKIQSHSTQRYGYLFAGGMFLFAVIAFFSDMLFRIFVKDLKRIWIVEIVFSLLALIILLLIRG